MPKKQHEALRRKGFTDEEAYRIMNSQKQKRRKK